MKQTLKLMHDYQCYALWDGNGNNLSGKEIGLSNELIEKINSWVKLNEFGIDLNNPLEGGYEGQNIDIFNKGKEIFLELLTEIGDEYDVLYWSNLENKFLSKKDIMKCRI